MTFEEYLSSLKGKTVGVIGVGVSNRPLIEKLLERGIDVTARDKKEDLGELGQALTAQGCKLRLGSGYLADLHENVIFRTPGLRPDVPPPAPAHPRNACAVLMCSRGTPMFLAGDEFGNTKFGNNNSYCQDNITSWLDWRMLEKNKDLFEFFKFMIAFRKKHPVIHKQLPASVCGMTEQKEGRDHPSVFERKTALGAGALCSGAFAGPCSARRPGSVPTVFLEVRCRYVGACNL